MSLSLADERRQQGESKDSNFVEIFKGTNLVSCFVLQQEDVSEQTQRRFFISAAIPLFAQLSGNSVST